MILEDILEHCHFEVGKICTDKTGNAEEIKENIDI